VRASTKAYFTDDDGATYFADEIIKAPPFDHNGKEAVRCYVFSCPGHGKFVGYLEKFTKEMQARISARLAVPVGPPLDEIETNSGRLLKKPGDAKWVAVQSQAGQAITNVKCPDDPSALITPENP